MIRREGHYGSRINQGSKADCQMKGRSKGSRKKVKSMTKMRQTDVVKGAERHSEAGARGKGRSQPSATVEYLNAFKRSSDIYSCCFLRFCSIKGCPLYIRQLCFSCGRDNDSLRYPPSTTTAARHESVEQTYQQKYAYQSDPACTGCKPAIRLLGPCPHPLMHISTSTGSGKLQTYDPVVRR